MNKSSGIAIRISEELRDSFNQWCKDNNIKASEHLRKLIELSVNGLISPNLEDGKLDISIDNTNQKVKQLEKEVSQMSSKIEDIIKKK